MPGPIHHLKYIIDRYLRIKRVLDRRSNLGSKIAAIAVEDWGSNVY